MLRYQTDKHRQARALARSWFASICPRISGGRDFVRVYRTRGQPSWRVERLSVRGPWPEGARRAFHHAGARMDDPRWAVLDLIDAAAWGRQQDRVDPPCGGLLVG